MQNAFSKSLKLIREGRCSACLLALSPAIWLRVIQTPRCHGRSWFCAHSHAWARGRTHHRGQHCLVDVSLCLGPEQLKWSVAFSWWNRGPGLCLMIPLWQQQARAATRPWQGRAAAGAALWQGGSASGHVWLEGRGTSRLSLISGVMWWWVLQHRSGELLIASVTIEIRVMDLGDFYTARYFCARQLSEKSIGSCQGSIIFLYEPSPKVL